MLEFYQKMFSYHHWAQEKFYSAVSELPAGEFTRDLGDGTGSVRDKLTHILGSEIIWFDRLRTKTPGPFLSIDDIPDATSLTSRARLHAEEFSGWFSGLELKSFLSVVSYKDLSGTPHTSAMGDILMHIFNHATYHRGQAASLIRRITGEAPATDFIVFVRNPGK